MVFESDNELWLAMRYVQHHARGSRKALSH